MWRRKLLKFGIILLITLEGIAFFGTRKGSDSISLENYFRIKKGMTYGEVKTILSPFHECYQVRSTYISIADQKPLGSPLEDGPPPKQRGPLPDPGYDFDYTVMFIDGKSLELSDPHGMRILWWFQDEIPVIFWTQNNEIISKANRRKSWRGSCGFIGIDFNSEGCVEQTFFIKIKRIGFGKKRTRKRPGKDEPGKKDAARFPLTEGRL